jgi:hypothetical protein
MIEGNFTLTPSMIWDGNKQPYTPEEIAERVAWFKQWREEVRKDNEVEPLTDDFMDYVKGRK